MGKKKSEEMAQQRSIFQLGAKNIGINKTLSMKIFDIVEKFSGYGFNKSHSTAYALVSYQTLWLKAHYPAAFMSAVMTSDIDNTDKIISLVDECLRMGLVILPPNINYGQYYFYVNTKNQIVYGMGAIKGIGVATIEAIIESRNKYGKFSTLFDLCSRIDIKKLDHRVLERLIMSGACDCLGADRSTLICSLNYIFKSANQNIKAKSFGQRDMFETLFQTIDLKQKNHNIPLSEQTILDKERQVLGIYLTGHPIIPYLYEIKHYTHGFRLSDIKSIVHGSVITVAGLILNIRLVITKTGNKIGICTIDDHSSRIDIIILTHTLEKYENILKQDQIIIVKGQMNYDHINDIRKIFVYELIDIHEIRIKYVSRLSIFLNNTQINKTFISRLNSLFKIYTSGTIPICFYYKNQNSCLKLNFKQNWYINPTNDLLNNLRALVGNEQIKLEFY